MFRTVDTDRVVERIDIESVVRMLEAAIIERELLCSVVTFHKQEM